MQSVAPRCGSADGRVWGGERPRQLEVGGGCRRRSVVAAERSRPGASAGPGPAPSCPRHMSAAAHRERRRSATGACHDAEVGVLEPGSSGSGDEASGPGTPSTGRRARERRYRGPAVHDDVVKRLRAARAPRGPSAAGPDGTAGRGQGRTASVPRCGRVTPLRAPERRPANVSRSKISTVYRLRVPDSLNRLPASGRECRSKRFMCRRTSSAQRAGERGQVERPGASDDDPRWYRPTFQSSSWSRNHKRRWANESGMSLFHAAPSACRAGPPGTRS